MSSNIYRVEKELITACAAGEAQAWTEFMRRYRRVIRATAGRLRQRFDPALADTDDLENYVYEKLLDHEGRRLLAWRGRAKYSTYLVGVSRNLVLDYYSARDKRRQMEKYRLEMNRAPLASPEPELPEWQNVRKEALREALTTLPEKQRLIMQLRLEGRTLSQIATITRRPLGTIGVENSRAMAKLRLVVDVALAKAEGRA